MASTHLVIAATAPAVRAALRQLFDPPAQVDLPDTLRDSAQIVLAEALNNIVEHSYAQSAGEIAVSLTPGHAGLVCHIWDTGRPMPLGVLPNGDTPMSCAPVDLPEGGFGWFLIRTLAQDLYYQRRNGSNHLSFCIPAETKLA